MAKLATCPGCTTQLALPEEATLSDRARCPRCAQKFMLMEAVQFSIPNAEILPPEPVAELPISGTVGPDDYLESPISSDYFPDPAARETASDEGDLPADSEQEALPASATLSDWEARLKRAIAANPDEELEPAEKKVPTPYEPEEFSTFASPEKPAREKFVSVPEEDDFSISEDDFQPESEQASPPPLGESSDENADESETQPVAAAQSTFDSVNDFTNDEFPADYADEYADDDPEAYSQPIEVEVNSSAATRKKKKRSIVRTMASASLGVIGIPVGLYVLLWLRGPAGDVVHIAQYLPSFMLPSSFDEPKSFERGLVTDETQIPRDSDLPPLLDDEPEIAGATEIAEAEIEDGSELHNDPEVAPAAAVSPLYQGPKFELVDPAVFAELLAAAEQAAPQLAEGNLNSKESVAQKGQAYMTLARLAEKCSYLNQPGLDLDQSAQAALAKQLIRLTLRKEDVKRDLPQIALRWWQYPQRPTPGMLLVGKIERLEPTEAGTIAYVSLGIDGVAPEVPVLLGNAEHKEEELIGAVGSIMANPYEQLVGIDASIGPMLISQYSFPLEQFADEDPTTAAADQSSQSNP